MKILSTQLYPITPVPAPRQTGRDAFNPSPGVVRYREFRDLVHAWRVTFPSAGARVEFALPMPASWSAKKREAMAGRPHQGKPDVDNLLKALIDGVFRDRDDSHIWHLAGVSKRWAAIGAIRIDTLEGPPEWTESPPERSPSRTPPAKSSAPASKPKRPRSSRAARRSRP